MDCSWRMNQCNLVNYARLQLNSWIMVVVLEKRLVIIARDPEIRLPQIIPKKLLYLLVPTGGQIIKLIYLFKMNLLQRIIFLGIVKPSVCLGLTLLKWKQIIMMPILEGTKNS